MRARDLLRALAGAVAVALTVSGCASTKAPSGWLPDARQSAYEASGGWIAAQVGPRDSSREVRGELIAVQGDSVFVLTVAGFEAIPAARIRAAQVASYDVNWGILSGWWVAGTLSTASHGWLLIVSAPIWILTGSLSTAAASRAPIVRYPDRAWYELGSFARFPQGLPPGLDRSALRLHTAVSRFEHARSSQGVAPGP